MLNIHTIKDNPYILDQSLEKRGLIPCSAQLLEYDRKRIKLQQILDQKREELKKNSVFKASNEQIILNKQLKINIAEIEAEYNKANDQFQTLLESLPNLVHPDVPKQDTIIKTWISPRHKTTSQSHEIHRNISKSFGAKLSGARFAVLSGKVAKLARILGYWLLEENTKAGYEEVHVPYMINYATAKGMGVLPKFEEDLFKTTTNHYLIPTAEGPLVGMLANEKIQHLPKLFTALTPCFRSEAGAAGRDTTGLIRLHQFSKVEIAGFVNADQVDEYHQKLLEHVENLLQKLELSYQIVEIGSLDLGFHAYRKFDIEVWMPGMNRYLEISSISQCLDFQTRRLNIHKCNTIHTINGSALPIERTLAAIIENYMIDKTQLSSGNCDFIVPQALETLWNQFN